MNGLDGRYKAHQLLMEALFGPTGQPPAWRRDAACVEVGPEVFYERELAAETRALCQSCPVMAECRQDQMQWEARNFHRSRERVGMVGGMTAAERRRARPFRKAEKEAA